MQDIKTTLDRQSTVATLNSIRTEIRKSGIRWKQARIALTSKDPEYRVKLDAINEALGSLANDEAFFSIDEFGPVAVKMRTGRSLQFPETSERFRSGSHGALANLDPVSAATIAQTVRPITGILWNAGALI
jgi:hypothetical protein